MSVTKATAEKITEMAVVVPVPENQMFSFISMNWQGRPLVSYRTIIELISATTTEKRLTIRAEADPNTYEKGIKVSNVELATVPALVIHDWDGR